MAPLRTQVQSLSAAKPPPSGVSFMVLDNPNLIRQVFGLSHRVRRLRLAWWEGRKLASTFEAVFLYLDGGQHASLSLNMRVVLRAEEP